MQSAHHWHFSRRKTLLQTDVLKASTKCNLMVVVVENNLPLLINVYIIRDITMACLLSPQSAVNIPEITLLTSVSWQACLQEPLRIYILTYCWILLRLLSALWPFFHGFYSWYSQRAVQSAFYLNFPVARPISFCFRKFPADIHPISAAVGLLLWFMAGLCAVCDPCEQHK